MIFFSIHKALLRDCDIAVIGLGVSDLLGGPCLYRSLKTSYNSPYITPIFVWKEVIGLQNLRKTYFRKYFMALSEYKSIINSKYKMLAIASTH